MSDKDELDRILGAFPCDFKPEEYGSRICTYCGESAGELRHRIKSELRSYIAQHTKEAVADLGFQVTSAKGFEDFEYFGLSVEPIKGFWRWWLSSIMKVATHTSSPDKEQKEKA